MRKTRCSILMACFHHLLRNEFGWSSYFTRVFGNSKRNIHKRVGDVGPFLLGFLMIQRKQKTRKTHTQTETRWWFQTFFIFTPIWGNDPILTSIFFRWRWFNHQLEKLEAFPPGFGDHLVLTRHISFCSTWKSKTVHDGLTWLCTSGGCAKSRWSLRLVCDMRCCWDISYGLPYRMHVHIPTWKP